MSDDKMTLITEEFEKDKTGEKVEGITVIVDGYFTILQWNISD